MRCAGGRAYQGLVLVQRLQRGEDHLLRGARAAVDRAHDDGVGFLDVRHFRVCGICDVDVLGYGYELGSIECVLG